MFLTMQILAAIQHYVEGINESTQFGETPMTTLREWVIHKEDSLWHACRCLVEQIQV